MTDPTKRHPGREPSDPPAPERPEHVARQQGPFRIPPKDGDPFRTKREAVEAALVEIEAAARRVVEAEDAMELEPPDIIPKVHPLPRIVMPEQSPQPPQKRSLFPRTASGMFNLAGKLNTWSPGHTAVALALLSWAILYQLGGTPGVIAIIRALQGR